MKWIYFSPHLDDVALSLGGLLWEQSAAGEKVEIWSICAGAPPPGPLSTFAQSLHERWGTGLEAISERRQEDKKSCRVLGAGWIHFDVPDCIYRRSPRSNEHIYDSEGDLWKQVHPDEKPLINRLRMKFREMLPKQAHIVCPLTLGNHIDHRLVRIAVETATADSPPNTLWKMFYYADYPYVLEHNLSSHICDLRSNVHTISAKGILAWQGAIACHKSQISTFWNNTDEMRAAIQGYYDEMGGIWLGST